MPSNANSRQPQPCPVCGEQRANKGSVIRHMKSFHKKEFAQLPRYRCPHGDCNKLDENVRADAIPDHLSMCHGVDVPRRMRTTAHNFLKRKNMPTLKKHIVDDSAEVNKINARIRYLERLLVTEGPPGLNYTSSHSFDVTTVLNTDPEADEMKKKDKEGLITKLQEVRDTLNEVGWLHTQPGVLDTREGLLDDLEKLMVDWP